MSRPTDYPDWATNANYGAGPYSGQPNKSTPPAGNIAEGFDPGAGVPAEWINSLFNRAGSWFRWLLTLPTTASDAPQYISQDAAGNNRSLIDHNGYPMGRRGESREDWGAVFASISANANPLVNLPKWQFQTTGTAGSLTQVNPSLTFPNAYMDVATAAAASSTAVLAASVLKFNPTISFVSGVFEYEVGVANIGVMGNLIDVGFASNAGISPSNYVRLHYGGSGNWIAQTSGGGSVDTGVAPTAATEPNQRIRIEMHGSGSPYSAACRFFINESLVATITTGIPNSTLWEYFGIQNGASTAINHLYVGNVHGVWNRKLSIAAL